MKATARSEDFELFRGYIALRTPESLKGLAQDMIDYADDTDKPITLANIHGLLLKFQPGFSSITSLIDMDMMSPSIQILPPSVSVGSADQISTPATTPEHSRST